MSSSERLDALRAQNKVLLAQLQQQRQKLETAVCGAAQSRKRDREDGEDESCEAQEELVTITNGGRGPARAALAKSSIITFSDAIEITESQTSSTTSELRAEDLTSLKPPMKRQQHILKNGGADECVDSLRSRPLLGYDWIAGVIDAEDSLMERSDDFFNDLCRFRALNREQCVTSLHSGFSEESDENTALPSDQSPETIKDTHQCTFSYRINNRLFPVPLNSEERCPVCKNNKSEHPHSEKEPALIRVSIPRSALLPPHTYKAHRRSSFDPSDSLALPSHCLSGWSNTVQSSAAAQSNLDLRSSVDTKKEAENQELKSLFAFKNSKQQKPKQIPQVSLLSRHNFQHFPLRK